jgi:hypothetical protein
MSATLEQLVNEVIDVTGADKPTLYEDDAPVLSIDAISPAQGDPAADQSFYLVGLIGGKEVGKSAVVNALVGRTITQSTSFGEGTQIATAYAHTSQAPALRELLEREVPGKYKVVTHDADALRRQVLLDLPDIDSHYAEHVDVTRRMLRHMLFPIWMQSVEKYADLQPQQMLAKVAAGNAAGNFIFCLNKVDQLAKAEGEAAVRELRDDYAERLWRLLSLPEPPRIFMISATNPDQFEFPALRKTLGVQKSAETVTRSKQAAASQQGNSVLAWFARQNLPDRVRRLANLEDDVREALELRLGAPLLERSIPAMLDDPSHRLTVLDDCLKGRAARWPFVGIVHGIASPITAIFRRRLSLDQQRGLEGAEALVGLHLRPDGRNLSDAVQTTFAQLHQSQPMVSALYRDRKLWEDRPADLAAADLHRRLADTVTRQRATIARRVCGHPGPAGSTLRWLLTVGAILWFPILQPIAEAALADTLGHGLRGIALAIVKSLSVAALLQTLTFMILWFVLIWLLVRWDTGRRVDRQLQKWKTADPEGDPTLSLPQQTLEWLDHLRLPIRQSKDRLESLVNRAEELKSQLESRAA